MKKIIFLALLPLFFFSCKKEERKNQKPNGHLVARIADYNSLNNEGKRIADAIEEYDYALAINDNPNFGHYSTSEFSGYDIFLNGKTPNDVKLEIDGNEYLPQDNGQWWKQGTEFKGYIGKTVSIKLSQGANSETFNYYIPKGITVPMLGENMAINRSGNTLTWTPDPDNLCEKIGIYYTLYDNDEIANGNGIIETNYVLVNDNDGSYSIDGLLTDTEVKRINFIVVRGNALSFLLNDGKKLLFSIKTCDSHEYIIN